MIGFSLVGVILVGAGWLHYLWLIPQERVPIRPKYHLSIITLGLTFGLWGAIGLPTWPGLALLVVSGALAGLFYYLLFIAHLPPAKLTVAVGQAWLPFTAVDDAGQAVSSQVWQGRRLLLKFFRGQW